MLKAMVSPSKLAAPVFIFDKVTEQQEYDTASTSCLAVG